MNKKIWTSVSIYLFAAIAIYYFYLIRDWHNGLIGFASISDSIPYLYMADIFSGKSYSETNINALTYFNLLPYPPLFPYMLGLFGGGGNSPSVAQCIVSIFWVLAFIAYFFWLRTAGVKHAHSALLVIVYSLLPCTYFNSLQILSEGLYVTLSLMALSWANIYPRHQYAMACAAVSVGLTSVTREAGYTLVLAFLIYVYIHQKKQMLFLGLLCVTPGVFWKIMKQLFGSRVDYSQHFVLPLVDRSQINYQIALDQLNGIWDAWLACFSLDAGVYSVSAAIIVLAFVIFGAILRVKQKQLDAIYVCIYMLLVLVWPYPSHVERFLLVILPLLLFYASIAAQQLGCAKAKPILPYLLAILFLSLALPSAYSIFTRLQRPIADSYKEFKYTRQWISPVSPSNQVLSFENTATALRSIRKIPDHVPTNACVYSLSYFMVGFYSRRLTFEPPIGQFNDADEFLKSAPLCRYFFIMVTAKDSRNRVEATYPLKYLVGRTNIVFATPDPTGKYLSLLLYRR